MRAVQTLLLGALLVVLSVIAFQLIQIRRELVPFAALSQGVIKAVTAPAPTPREHEEQLRRDTRHSMHDTDVVIDEALKTAFPKVKKTTPSTPAVGQAQRQ